MRRFIFHKFCFLLCFYVYLFQWANAQMVPYGKEFFYSNMYSTGVQQQLALSSKYHATAEIQFLSSSADNFSVTLTPNTIHYVDIDYALAGSFLLHSPATIDNNSLRIISDSNIVVHILNAYIAIDDATTVYPVAQPQISENKDTFFLLHPYHSFSLYTRAVLVSHYDCVEIEILSEHEIGEHPPNIPFNIILNKGEVYPITSYGYFDYTGTRIRVVTSLHNNPISIFNGNLTNVVYPWTETDICCADFTIENCMPTYTYDTLFFTVPPAKVGEDSIPLLGAIPSIIKVLSPTPDNQIYIDNNYVTTLNTGEVFDTSSTLPMKISSDFPITVHQFTPSFNSVADNEYGDPDHVQLFPLKQGFTETYLSNFEFYDDLLSSDPQFCINVATLITQSEGLEVMLDGTNINSWFVPLPADDAYVYTQFMPEAATLYHLTSAHPMVGYFASFYKYAGGSIYTLEQVDGPFNADEFMDTIPHRDTIPYYEICDAIELTGRPGATSYLWSNGATSGSTYADHSGYYWVVSYFLCDSIVDSFLIHKIDYPDDLLEDQFICNGDTIYVDVFHPAFDHYLWDDGGTTSSRTFYKPGTYSVEATLPYINCPVIRDTMYIRPHSLPRLELEPYVFVCDSIPHYSIGNHQEGMYYRWNTGDTTCCIQVDKSGLYEVTVRNECGDSIVRSTEIEFIGCDFCLRVPNAFSPNHDGINDEFRVVTDCQFEFFQMDIYDRWGNNVYRTFKSEQGWDGNLNGSKMDMGVYFYYIRAVPKNGNSQMIETKGDVTLLR